MTMQAEAEVGGWVAKLLARVMGNLAWVIVALLVLAALGYGAYRLFGDGPRHALATATATNAVSAAGTASAHDAIETVNANSVHADTIRDTTRIDHETIVHEPGANIDLSPELDAAGRAAWCMHDSAAGDPECQRLRKHGP